MKLFSQPNFKTKVVTLNSQPFTLTELSAEGLLSHTEYQAECAQVMKAVQDGLPENTDDWTEQQVSKLQMAHTVFLVRVRVRLVALSLQPSINADPNHPLCNCPLVELEETLLQEMKVDQLKTLEDEALELNQLNSLSDPNPKPSPDATLPTN